MEWITIADWPGGKLETLEELTAALPEQPDGLRARYAGEIDGALRIVAVWESQAHAEKFFAWLPEAHAQRLAPVSNGVPTVTAMQVESRFVA